MTKSKEAAAVAVAAVGKEKGTQDEGGVSGGSKPPVPRRTSVSPSPRRGRSLMRGGGEIVVRERVIRESSGNTQYPTLTRTNYPEWTMVMRVQLQAAHLWDVIGFGAEEEGDDRAALSALLRAVPPELAVKDCAKTAWETIKTMRLGCERIREAKGAILIGGRRSAVIVAGASHD